MRIAIYHNLPSGGGKRALFEMTHRLAQRHEIDVFTLSTAEHDFCDLRPHVRQHIVMPFAPLPLARRPFGRLNQGIRTLDLLRLRTLQKKIAAAIDGAGYDVAFVHNCQFGQSPGLLSFLQTPSVYYCQEPPRLIHEPPVPRPYTRLSRWQRLGNIFDPLPGLYRRTLMRLDRANVRSANRILVNSHYSRESLYRVYGIFSSVCYLGVDVSLFRPQAREREYAVLSVGALTPKKGFDFIINSLSLIDSARRPAFWIVSNFAIPAERDYLTSLAQEMGVDVTFRTGVSDEELVTLYNRAALVAYAPIMEPFGFVPLEAMACGTPVVGVREGGVRETVRHGETGLLAERNPARFAAAVAGLLEDDGLRQRYSRQGQAYVEEQWNWERSVRELEAHLEAVGQAASGEGV